MGDAAGEEIKTRTQKKNDKKRKKDKKAHKAADDAELQRKDAAGDRSGGAAPHGPLEQVIGLLMPEIFKALEEDGARTVISEEETQELRENIGAIPKMMARTIQKMRMCTTPPPPHPSATQNNSQAAKIAAATTVCAGPPRGQHSAEDAELARGQHGAHKVRGRAKGPDNGDDGQAAVYAEMWEDAHKRAKVELHSQGCMHDSSGYDKQLHEQTTFLFKVYKKKYKNKQRKRERMKQYCIDAYDRGEQPTRRHMQQKMVAK